MNGYSSIEDIKYAADRQAKNQAINDLRNAMYNFEYKTVNNLQLINGGGVAVLVGFLSRSEVSIHAGSKWPFLFAIIFFIVGLLASLWLSVIFPSFMEARYLQSEKQADFKKQDRIRKWCMNASIGCFILAIALSTFGWILS